MEDVLKDFFNGNDFSYAVWRDKYALKDDEGNLIETNPDQTIRRVAKQFAEIEKRYPNPLSENEIYEAMKGFKCIIPGGSVLSGCGSKTPISLSNCFVIDSPKDSYDSIMNTRNKQVQLMKRRGGVGVDISELRPRGASVNNAAITSTGAASFMDGFSAITKEVAQNGRRGALMLTMNVEHPDIEEFISVKQDLTKVTGANISVKISDEFMKAVEDDKDFILRFPCDIDITNINPEEYEYGKLVRLGHKEYIKRAKATDIWNLIVHCAWNTAEPGVIFVDRMHKYAPDECYEGFKMVSTNPCVVGETKVAVADGRGYVSIKELADKGDDVPVFCLNDKGKLCVSLMRNPRITGYDEDIYEIEIEGGHKIKCTGNHKILLNGGGYVEAKDIKEGDSLFLLTRELKTIKEEFGEKMNFNGQKYAFMRVSGSRQGRGEHRYIYEYYNGYKPQVVHHKDYNALNNNPENLIGLTKKEHDILHSKDMMGDKNPIFKILSDEEKSVAYRKKMSESVSGEKNPRFKISNEKYFQEAVNFAKSIGRQFYMEEWLRYCNENNLPVFTKYREKYFNGKENFIKMATEEAGQKYYTVKGKKLQQIQNALRNGYKIDIVNDEVYVLRRCENCGKEFKIPYDRREVAFCSLGCSAKYISLHNDKYISSRKEITKKHRENAYIKNSQAIKLLEEFPDIKNKRDFTKKYKDKYNEVYKWRNTFSFKTIEEIKEAQKVYNHKVLSVRLIGKDNVYNGTVDNYHNFFIGGFEENVNGRCTTLSINNLQCGEIGMGGGDSCRLIAVNLASIIDNPYAQNEDLILNASKLTDLIHIACRLGDDLVDMEIDAVNRILSTIGETEETERKIWQHAINVGRLGRRTGIGFLGLADMLAMIGVKYDSEEGKRRIESIMRFILSEELWYSITLAQERGAFPIFDAKLEKEALENGNEFFAFIKQEFPKQWEAMQKYGRRNISWSTVAPTGTISNLAQVTSGIEPLFFPFYERKKKCMKETDRVDYVDKVGEKFTTYIVVHQGLKNWAHIAKGISFKEMEDFNVDKWQEIYEESPYYKAIAPDINYNTRCEIQGIIQKYISHSISSTINLPRETTEKEVSDIYFKAWRSGCKGITIYRDGSREGIITAIDKKKEEKKFFSSDIRAPKRPKSLEADFYTTKVKGEVFYVMVGMYEERPYEVFVYNATKSLENPRTIENHRGLITKVAKNKYNFQSEIITIQDISSDLTTEELSTALYSSMLLRHGAGLKYIIKTAKKVDDNIMSFTSAMTRILSKYLPKETLEEVCPECGGRLIREGGCIHCIDCSYSKCS